MNIAIATPRALAAMMVAAALGAAVALPAPAVATGTKEVSVAVLRGANEPTTGGDVDAVGVAIFGIHTDTGQICFLVAHVKLDGTVVAAHIHRAPAGVNGPVVVPFTAPTGHITKGCVTAAPALAAEIAGNPSGFYYNIHTNLFPGGAIRGQLGP
jgi:hypothetical protein